MAEFAFTLALHVSVSFLSVLVVAHLWGGKVTFRNAAVLALVLVLGMAMTAVAAMLKCAVPLYGTREQRLWFWSLALVVSIGMIVLYKIFPKTEQR
jgi:hypothetical protein